MNPITPPSAGDEPHPGLPSDIEAEVQRLGQEVFNRINAEKQNFWNKGFWNDKLIDMSLKNEAFKVQLFRFVDLLPSLKTAEQMGAHLQAYFGEDTSGLPSLLQWGAGTLGRSRMGSGVVGKVLRKNIQDMARRFIVGETPREALATLSKRWKEGLSATLDILGEKVVNEQEAQVFQRRYLDLLDACSVEMARWPTLPHETANGSPRINVSVKLSALYSQAKVADFEGTVTAVKDRLRPIFRKAREVGAFINLDMEDYHSKEVTLRVFQDLVLEPEFADYEHFGLVLQAYLRDAASDVRRVIALCQKAGRRFSVRLVKGAYWDFETVLADQKAWPCPVFREKWQTDANYEHCLGILLENHVQVKTAVGSHNVRSIAVAMALVNALQVPPTAYEFQVLHGMAGPVERALLDLGQPVRQYAPLGDLLEGMAYLVRRLLENTSNESFLRRGFSDGMSQETLLEPPLKAQPREEKPAAVISGFRNEPPLDFARAENREKMTQAIADLKKRLPLQSGPMVAGHTVKTERFLQSRNPADPEQIVANVAVAGIPEADKALAAARSAFGEWSERPVAERCGILRRAADLFGQRRFELNALMVLETGKSWSDADGDLSEAIDFLRYYASEMERLGTPRRTQHLPGEDNFLLYQPRGVGVVIAPWNFPLAISTGMTTAALVAGNCVLYKPAETSSMTGAMMASLLYEAGVPTGALAYVPGYGEEVGAYLAAHPDVAFITFTGSKEVGLKLIETAGHTPPHQIHVKRVIAEMGGKNALIVDDDADLDEAVRGIVYSAFGFQGQKCSAASRVIALETIHDRLSERLSEAIRSLTVGAPESPASDVGPVIDEDALQRIRGYIDLGRQEGQVLAQASLSTDKGHFVPPILFTGISPDSRLAQEEIFGPVLVLLKAKDFDQALEMANRTAYKLTGGLYSRNPVNIERAKRQLRVGNLYINRGITGAIVERQPFGGSGLSGIGAKAGGPDYLIQFMEARTITENTLRQGFAPPSED